MNIDKAKLDLFLKSLKNYTCPLCGTAQWIINDKIFFLPEYHEDGFYVGGPSYPVIPLSCRKCGNTLFINAIISGLFEANEAKSNGK